MSLCICLQNSDGLMIAADTAATINHEGVQYRFRQPYQKLIQIDRFLVFMSGSAGAGIRVLQKFNACAEKSPESFRRALIEGCGEFSLQLPQIYESLESDTRDVGGLLAEWTPKGGLVHTFQKDDEFMVHTHQASSTETIPHAGGFNADAALDKIGSWLLQVKKTKPMSVAIREIFESLSGGNIGGTLTLATINRQGISFLTPLPIREQVEFPYYEDTQGNVQARMHMVGSYITTKKNAFPRCEMSSTGNVFAAYTNAGNKIAIDPNYAGVPSLDFYMNGVIKGKLDTISSIMELVGNGGLLLYANGGDLELNPSTGFVTVPTWYKILNGNTGRTLGEELSEIYDRLEALEEAGA